MIRVELPWPHKALWPNGRPHHMAKAREVKKHRQWANTATLAAYGAFAEVLFDHLFDDPIPIHIIVHAKPKGPLPDKDGCVSASKAFLDGIADRLGINDRHFAAPTVEFATPRDGRFIIEIGARP